MQLGTSTHSNLLDRIGGTTTSSIVSAGNDRMIFSHNFSACSPTVLPVEEDRNSQGRECDIDQSIGNLGTQSSQPTIHSTNAAEGKYITVVKISWVRTCVSFN